MEADTAGGVRIETIKVDSREPDNVIKAAHQHFTTVEIDFLPVGDFVCGDVCIERKKLGDFVNSVNSGRMDTQAMNMNKNYSHNFIIIIGKMSQLYARAYNSFTPRRYHREVARLMANHGVKVYRVENNSEFYDLVYQIFQQYDHKNHGEKNNIKRIAPRSGDAYVDMVCVVDKIGPKKARDILKSFKVHELFDASEKDLMSIKGIGKTQAARIKKVFHR